jgi:hypothetical protein
VIAAAIAVLGIAQGAEAQKDAAEKAQEGGIDHWIEYYKAQQGKPTPASAREPVAASPAESAVPVERSDPGAQPRKTSEGK